MFTITGAIDIGPRGGKRRGYTVLWTGNGRPPGGRAARSGWYLHRTHAERARDIANSEAARLAARISRPPLKLRDGLHIVELTAPDGAVSYFGYSGQTPDGEEVERYATLAGAQAAAQCALGNGPAFWNSERASKAKTQTEMRGYTVRILEG